MRRRCAEAEDCGRGRRGAVRVRVGMGSERVMLLLLWRWLLEGDGREVGGRRRLGFDVKRVLVLTRVCHRERTGVSVCVNMVIIVVHGRWSGEREGEGGGGGDRERGRHSQVGAGGRQEVTGGERRRGLTGRI